MSHFSFERDPVIEAYKKDIDRTLLHENLRRSVDERMAQLIAMAHWVDACRESLAAKQAVTNGNMVAEPEALLEEKENG